MSFGGLYISISGLNASKKSLDTVSHNISNVNNPNYVRQSAIYADSRYRDIGNGIQRGTGVDIQEIRQIRDEFLDQKYRKENSTYGYWEANSQILHEVEMVFNERIKNELTGLQKVMNDFWDAWTELGKEPDSLTIRGVVHESAVAFTETVNHMYTQLGNLQRNLNREIEEKVDEVNNILVQIADLNMKIKKHEGITSNISANDYRYERNALLDRLSCLVPISYDENYVGEVVVSLNNRNLVNSDYFNPIILKKDERGFGRIYWADTGDKIDLKGKGELGGYIDARDIYVQKYMDDLDLLVGTIAKEVNKLHKTGYDLTGAEGKDFFVNRATEKGENIKAVNIIVNPYLSNFNHIAASESGDIGDGKIAEKILGLREEKVEFNGVAMTFDDFYRDVISNLGVDRNKARVISSNQEILLKQIDDNRKSISQVSLDEEMTNMMKFQHYYTANSRVINAIDEMIDQVVNRMGIVGR